MENKLILKELLSHFKYPKSGSWVRITHQGDDGVLFPVDYVLSTHWADSEEEVEYWDFSFTPNTLYIKLKESKMENTSEGHNTGDENKGDFNTGSHNVGDSNTGDYNEGEYNKGYSNKGSYNIGIYNEGDWNIGLRNKGSYCVGFCCTEATPLYLFNKPSKYTIKDLFDMGVYHDLLNGNLTDEIKALDGFDQKVWDEIHGKE